MNLKTPMALAISAGGFAAMDRNKDGYISREFEALQGAAGATGGIGDKPGQKQ
jgi:hypothetical protein